VGGRDLVRTVRRHRVPAWWQDAKLGIFVHWTPASVPAFAPTDADIGELLASGAPDAMSRSPYAEWYENSLRFPGSPVAAHHATTYGDRPYRTFAHDWEAALDHWDPDGWAGCFAATGARYVVLVAKHHDGYCLWPTAVANPRVPGFHSRRDVVGELAEAVRARGMRFGLYYSGGLDWTWNDHPIGSISDVALAMPRGRYGEYAEAHVRELVERYRPSVLWNDIAWPTSTVRLAPLLAHYYASVPDGVVNDRFLCRSPAWELGRVGLVRRQLDRAAAAQARAHGLVPPKPQLYDVRTPEYTSFDDIQQEPWECVRGIDRSFGHNRASLPEHFLARDDLVWSLVDVVSKGGNLLLNVGPRGEDATIPDAQRQRLDWLAELTASVGTALFATRPWVRAAEEQSAPGVDVRYTCRDREVFALVTGATREVRLRGVAATSSTQVVRAPDGRGLSWTDAGHGLTVALADAAPPGGVHALALRDVTAR
jgi:alpha-L-fucosidase